MKLHEIADDTPLIYLLIKSLLDKKEKIFFERRSSGDTYVVSDLYIDDTSIDSADDTDADDEDTDADDEDQVLHPRSLVIQFDAVGKMKKPFAIGLMWEIPHQTDRLRLNKVKGDWWLEQIFD